MFNIPLLPIFHRNLSENGIFQSLQFCAHSFHQRFSENIPKAFGCNQMGTYGTPIPNFRDPYQVLQLL